MGGVQVSVSFGKYENDGEKWSAFSPNNNNNNKYLEEVGKCSTPGSVAQKKAFFEAHYKKIAAMKKLAEAQEEPPIHDDKPPVESPIIPFNCTATDKLEEAALVNAESMKLVQEHFQVDLQLKMDPKKEEKVASASNKQTTAFSDSSTRRRSLFMEQMGDKDIVKRVFKTLLPKQLPPEKQNQRSRKAAADKVNPQLGATVRKSGVALKTQDGSQRRKQLLEDKSNAERSQLPMPKAKAKAGGVEKHKLKKTLKSGDGRYNVMIHKD